MASGCVGVGAYPDYQIRLFRRGKAHYNAVEIHENLLVSGEVGTLKESFRPLYGKAHRRSF